MSQKNALRIVPFEVDEDRTGYEMIHCTNVNKFFVFEFKLVEKKDAKVPLMNQGDYIVLYRSNVRIRMVIISLGDFPRGQSFDGCNRLCECGWKCFDYQDLY